jgi:hypothetical protein
MFGVSNSSTTQMTANENKRHNRQQGRGQAFSTMAEDARKFIEPWKHPSRHNRLRSHRSNGQHFSRVMNLRQLNVRHTMSHIPVALGQTLVALLKSKLADRGQIGEVELTTGSLPGQYAFPVIAYTTFSLASNTLEGHMGV